MISPSGTDARCIGRIVIGRREICKAQKQNARRRTFGPNLALNGGHRFLGGENPKYANFGPFRWPSHAERVDGRASLSSTRAKERMDGVSERGAAIPVDICILMNLRYR
jgi:hypothetical protein